jgi:hypothetical protein
MSSPSDPLRSRCRSLAPLTAVALVSSFSSLTSAWPRACSGRSRNIISSRLSSDVMFAASPRRSVSRSSVVVASLPRSFACGDCLFSASLALAYFNVLPIPIRVARRLILSLLFLKAVLCYIASMVMLTRIPLRHAIATFNCVRHLSRPASSSSSTLTGHIN